MPPDRGPDRCGWRQSLRGAIACEWQRGTGSPLAGNGLRQNQGQGSPPLTSRPNEFFLCRWYQESLPIQKPTQPVQKTQPERWPQPVSAPVQESDHQSPNQGEKKAADAMTDRSRKRWNHDRGKILQTRKQTHIHRLRKEIPAAGNTALFHSHTLGKVAGLIHITAAQGRDLIGKQLQGNSVQHRRQILMDSG